MKCIIVGVKPQDYVNKENKRVQGLNIYMLSDNVDVFGKVFKDCFVSNESPLYKANVLTFDDMDQLLGREVNAEWDIEQYGQKAVKRLIKFDFLDGFYDFVERKAVKSEKAAKND